MGRWHAHAARKAGSTVKAVVDRDAGSAGRLAAGHGARAFSDPAAMLSEARPRVVHICTPLGTHEDLALQAIEAGAHVLVEKPLAPSLDSTRAILEAARRRGVLACPVHQFAFQRGVLAAAEALPSLGEALRVDFRIASAGGEGLDDDARDALVADILPHPFSVLQALWPRQVARPGDWSAARPRAGELAAQGRLGDVSVNLYISLAARPPCCEADLFGSEGSLHLDFFHGFCAIRRTKPSRVAKALAPFRAAGGTAVAAAGNLAQRAWTREPAYPGLATLVARFHRAVRAGDACPVPPEAALEVAAMREHLVALSRLPQEGSPPRS